MPSRAASSCSKRSGSGDLHNRHIRTNLYSRCDPHNPALCRTYTNGLIAPRSFIWHASLVELNRQRKAFLSVLGLAAVGLVLDRAVLNSGGPASASAATPDVASPLIAKADAPADPGPVQTVADRLNGVHTSSAGVAPIDAFAGTPQWLPSATITVDVEPSNLKARAASPDPLTSIRRLNLTTLFGRDERASARVNGRMVKVGEQIEGFTFEGIDNSRGIFSDSAGRYSVSLRGEIELLSAPR